jgi:shikimate dehydrogenase
MSPKISGRTRVAAVLGRPILGSLSPLIHNAWIDQLGLDAVYVALSPSADRFQALVRAAETGAFAGFNVTAPFKKEALACAQTADPVAERAGAANLIVFNETAPSRAFNTDGEGLMYALAHQAPHLEVTDAAVVVLGAGGAARGAVAALAEAGAAEIRILNRSQERAVALAADCDVAQAFVYEALSEVCAGAALIVNAAAPAPLDAQAWLRRLPPPPAGAAVLDMTYRPLETPFLAAARTLGYAVADGLEMLIGQARPSFHRLFGVEPPASEDVRSLALTALGESL